MKTKPSLVLSLPFLVFGSGVFLYRETQSEAHVQFVRAEEQWRSGNYREAIDLYEGVHKDHPKSRYADDALWEIATIQYVNFYQINRAVSYFQMLLDEYPTSPLVRDAQLRLAEIHEGELTDIPQAIHYWRLVLATEPPGEQRRQILFKMANAYFKINRFEKARERFGMLFEGGEVDHFADQSRIRAGTILQILKEYASSTRCFREILSSSQCADCRIQARLGLIESYEFMGELGSAIETAQAIRDDEYPEAMKQDLLKRLQEKRKYYQPKRSKRSLVDRKTEMLGPHPLWRPLIQSSLARRIRADQGMDRIGLLTLQAA